MFDSQMPTNKSISIKRTRGRPKQSFTLRRVTLTVDPQDWKCFEVLGRENGMSSALLIRLAMKDFLKRCRNGQTIDVTIGKALDNR